MTKLVDMGKIIGVFGIQGWVKIKTNSDMNTLVHYKKLQLTINNTNSVLEIEKSHVKNGIWFVLFKSIYDRNKSEELIGSTVAVNRDDFPNTGANEYYWIDLIGLKVINLQNELLGTIDSMMDTGAHSVMVVKNEDKSRLIPFVHAYVTNVDMQNKQVIVDWGLDY